MNHKQAFLSILGFSGLVVFLILPHSIALSQYQQEVWLGDTTGVYCFKVEPKALGYGGACVEIDLTCAQDVAHPDGQCGVWSDHHILDWTSGCDGMPWFCAAAVDENGETFCIDACPGSKVKLLITYGGHGFGCQTCPACGVH